MLLKPWHSPALKILGTPRLALYLIEDLTTCQAGPSSLFQVDNNLTETAMATEETAGIGTLETLVNTHQAIDEVEIPTPENLEDPLIATWVLNENVSDSIHHDGLRIRLAKILRELRITTV